MLSGLKGLLESKKFWLTVIGSALMAGMSAAGVPHEVAYAIGALFGVNVAAQGIADTKK